MDSKRLDGIEARAAKATDGPWEWYGNTKFHECHLATTHSGRIYVLSFRRWGMGSAQPQFQVYHPDGCGVLEDVERFARYECDYRRDFVGLDHPDAEFIAAARADVPDLVAEVRRLVGALRQVASVDTDPEYADARVEWCKDTARDAIARYEVKP